MGDNKAIWLKLIFTLQNLFHYTFNTLDFYLLWILILLLKCFSFGGGGYVGGWQMLLNFSKLEVILWIFSVVCDFQI